MDTTISERPLEPLAPSIEHQAVTPAALAECIAGRTYARLTAYFDGWPERSLMGPHSRAVLYTLARMLRPEAVAEVGTLHAGTSEVLARALWENGTGELHTADPFGADRCPQIIATWPPELHAVTQFQPVNSMAFWVDLARRRVPLGLVLVDGNHDYEFALYDLQMAARLLRPGGVVVMDNSDQTGPFEAARAFLAMNPAWRELGNAIATHDATDPFNDKRASLPNTAFVLLQSPSLLSIGALPWSTGTMPTASAWARGLELDLPPQRIAGQLHYRVFVRAFADHNRWVGEVATKGAIRIKMEGGKRSIIHQFPWPLGFEVPTRFPEAVCNVEIDLAWQADADSPPLMLSSPPFAF
ncbi:MAG: hypothetical protein GEV13_36425 [Rhodospirillales bacterium]|nr:hypothetical protein [Rhodospirillales bacterium]